MKTPEEILTQIKAYLTEEWMEPMKKSVVKKEPASGKMSPKAEALAELEAKCGKCRACGLYKTANNLVFFDGDPDASLVFIGEAPGADEDAQGKPFVGRAGKLLTATIEELGVPRSRVYICNILKHRPPENRNPLPDEIAACTPHLLAQLEIIRPKIIVTLGNFSTKFILNTEEGISKLRGTVKESPLGYKVIPCYHPAAILRNMNLIGEFKSDIRKAIDGAKK